MQSQQGNVLSIAVSGLRGTGRTSLYQQLKLVLPKDYSLRECDFAFLGNPFDHLKHPILWAQHKKHGVSRLHECWGMLTDFTEDEWLPALQAGKIPVMDGCGLDALLYATACIGCKNDDAKVMEYHREWVQDRIVKQGISPPVYLITRADPKGIVRYLTRTVPSFTTDDARAFIEKERTMIAKYFEDGSGQHSPHYLEPTLSTGAMVAESVAYIRRRIPIKAVA